VELTEEQKEVLRVIEGWRLNKKGQSLTLGGYAGTGKTTVISWWRKEVKEKEKKIKVSFCAYTGKAARVLKNKLSENKAIFPSDTVGTIHSLIYSPILNKKEEIIGWKKKEKIESEMIVVDEASMIDEEIWKALLSYRVPILAVGDHGQLAPIKGNFNLMERLDLRLEQIHRQALENPIIELSIRARKDGFIPTGRYGEGVEKVNKFDPLSGEKVEERLRDFSNDKLIMCGYNQTRVRLNKFIREAREMESEEPCPGDKVICLRNNHSKEIYNGMMGTILTISSRDEDSYETEIELEDGGVYEGLIFKKQFNSSESLNFTDKRIKVRERDLWDFGYAVTVHKAQGSEAEEVILFEERFPRMSDEEWKRWLYTAVSRAKERLLIIGQ